MPSASLFKGLLKAHAGGQFLFPALRQDIMKEQEEDAARKWNGRISPSKGLSYTMCPQEFVYVKLQEPFRVSNETKYKMLLGHAVHAMVQKRIIKRIPDLLYARPRISDDLLAELDKNWPEVPVKDDEFGVKGRLDLVLNIQGQPVIVDIKTTSILSSINLTLAEMQRKIKEVFADGTPLTAAKVSGFLAWLVHPDQWQESWEKEKKKYPQSNYKMQLAIYAYLCNKLKYYDKPIRRLGLAYINLCIPSGDPKGEFETYWDFTVEEEQKVGTLLEHVNIHRMTLLEGKEKVPCTYALCSAHGEGSTK